MITTLKSGEVRMRCFTFGTGKKNLVILPGLSVSPVLNAAPTIRKEYAVFENDFKVFVLERRENLPPIYSIAQMAEDTASVLMSAGLGKVCLFGASQGGMVALALALNHPHLVEALALGSTAASYPAGGTGAIAQWVTLAKAGDKKGLYAQFAQAIYPPKLYQKYQNALALLSESVTREELERFIILAEGTGGFDVSERLGEISCPVLILGAEDDAVLGVAASRQLIRGLGNNPVAEHYIYPPGYAHAAYDTAPDYKQRLYAFFSKTVTLK